MKLLFSLAIAALALASLVPGRAADPALPSLADTLQSVPALFYAEMPRQAPSPVIESGLAANLPCSSFQIGPDRELNIYGDPEHPVCIEFALYGPLAHSEAEMHHGMELLHRLVAKIELSTIRLDGGKLLRGGLMAEVRPPTDPAARGAWRISLSDLARLNQARGTSTSISAISVASSDARESIGWTDAELKSIHGPLPDSARIYVRNYAVKHGAYVPVATPTAPRP